MGLARAVPSYGGAVLDTLPTMVTDVASGNYFGALLQLGSAFALSSQHSNWWYADNCLINNSWSGVMQMYVQFFAQPSFNSNGKGGFQGDLAGMVNSSIVPVSKGGGTVRYLLLPAIFQNTFSGNICILMQAAVQENLLPASVLPAATTIAAVNASAVEPDTIAEGNAMAVQNFDKFAAAGNWPGMSQQACKLYFDPWANITSTAAAVTLNFDPSAPSRAPLLGLAGSLCSPSTQRTARRQFTAAPGLRCCHRFTPTRETLPYWQLSRMRFFRAFCRGDGAGQLAGTGGNRHAGHGGNRHGCRRCRVWAYDDGTAFGGSRGVVFYQGKIKFLYGRCKKR